MENSGSGSILQAEDLSIGYRSKRSRTILASGIQMSLFPQELVAVIGINGVGKSTFLRTLSGIQPPLSGQLKLNGKNLQQSTALELATLRSLVLTEQPVSKNLSVFELVALGRQPYTNWIGRLGLSDLRYIRKSLELVEITHLQDKKCYELSDGQLQKVLIARALAQNTPLVILDEPTTHLDLYHKAYVLQLLRKLTRNTGKTIIFASHEINLALQLCDRIVLMQEDGLQIGSPEALVKNGAFSRLFPGDLIIFDSQTASFKVRS